VAAVRKRTGDHLAHGSRFIRSRRSKLHAGQARTTGVCGATQFARFLAAGGAP
jgi:hypothetical protein